jgi:hypothetical protein
MCLTDQPRCVLDLDAAGVVRLRLPHSDWANPVEGVAGQCQQAIDKGVPGRPAVLTDDGLAAYETRGHADVLQKIVKGGSRSARFLGGLGRASECS